MSTIEQYQPGLNEAGAYFDLRQQVFAYELAEAGVIDDRIQSLMRYRTQEGYEQGMREVINDPSRQFIGMRDEQGLIAYMITCDTWPDDPDGQYLESIGVHQRARRQGYATQLVSQFTAGEKATYLHVIEANLPAKELYEGLGFMVIGKDKPWDIWGQKVSVEIMKREGETT